VLAAVTRIEADERTKSVDCLYTTGAPWLASHDRLSTAVVVTLQGAEHEKQKALPRLTAALTPDASTGMSVQFTGIVLVNEAAARIIARDLVRGELFALPLTLLVLLWVFRGVVAALLPVLMGICANLVAFAALRTMTYVTEVSVFAINIATLLALGLAIDCSLFVVTRFREELKISNGGGADDVVAAVSRSMGSAGRAVFFSGAVVALSMMALMAMPQMLIRSLGYAGVVVVVSTLMLMIFLLPAVLVLLGPRVEALPLPIGRVAPEKEGAFFFRLAKLVMGRPLVVAVVCGGGLLVLAAPFLRMIPSIPDFHALPVGDPVRDATDAFNQEFLPNQLTPHDVVCAVDGDVFSPVNLKKLLTVQREMEALPGVTGVQSVFTAQKGVSPESVVDVLLTKRSMMDPALRALLARFLTTHADGTGLARFVVMSSEGYNGRKTAAQVRSLRLLHVDGVSLKVGGPPAVLVDLLDRLAARAPFALAIVGVAMFLVLFLAFRSVVVPIKAIVMNCLSMTASFGALVWIFQDGRFQGVLRYESQGFTDATTPLVMFCLVFGLSMDYEVLLLGRIREEALRAGPTGSTEDAVAIGLMKTGRTITSAALLLIVVVGAFGLSEVLTMKTLGLGIALSVALDATVVRALLVPATMKLLGRYNWWPSKL
jgi:RND superfamily putative drug exporter